MDLPSGLVTFLFTDIEGSTRRWETDPAGMRAALAEAIVCAVSDPGRLERMALAAQRHVTETYSWDRVAERIVFS